MNNRPSSVPLAPERVSEAFWVTGPGHGEIRRAPLRSPGPGEVEVRTLYSGVSRGTESLVFRGGVPRSEWQSMRAPFQVGEFPAPVKYGYLGVGEVVAGESDLVGRTVFCLHPHQTRFVVPASSVAVVPDGVPARRAVLAGTVETGLNALWDLGTMVGDRVSVVGAGMVGCTVARLLAGIPEVEVTLVDVDPDRAATAAALGVGFAGPDQAVGDRDAVVHASATGTGLQTALGLAAREGTVLDLSWYGDEPVTLTLGTAFHARRLQLRASQVGSVAPARRDRRSRADRLAIALRLLRDPAFDVLLTDQSDFAELPQVMARIAAGRAPGLCHTIAYPAGDECSRAAAHEPAGARSPCTG